MTSLLERVRFLGGDGSGQEAAEPETQELPPLLDQDPEPASAVRAKPRNTRPAAARPASTSRTPRNGGKFQSKAAVEKGVADELNMWLKLMAGMWSLSDEHCAGVLNETSEQIAADMAKLASRSDWLMERFETTSLLADLGKAMVHLAPLVRAMWQHHGPSARRAEQEEETHDAIPVMDPNAYGPWRPSMA